MAPIRARDRRRGVALIWGAMTVMLLLPVVGLCVDSVVMFIVKERLSAAVDGAAAAVARAPETASVDDVARRYFDANFPEGFLLTDARGRTCTVVREGNRIKVTGAVSAPVYFMRMLHAEGTRLVAVGAATVPGN